MIRSMTGFGRSINNFATRRYTIEIKTVNHRYNDTNIRMPRYMIGLEDKLRKLISESVSRGKIDVFINVENLSDENQSVKIDESLAGSYIEEMRKLIDKYNLSNDITATSVLRLPDVINYANEIDEEEYWKELNETATAAIEALNSAREKEGENLKADLLNRLLEILPQVDFMKERSAGLVDEYKKKLEARLDELNAKGIVDEARLGAELVLFADKSSIAEEITRLYSHIKSFQDILNGKDNKPIGKKLDFILQEMNREINTIGSKANCLDITNAVVFVKNEIENIREQVQNIE